MIIALCVALALVAIYLILRYFSLKRDQNYKIGLAQAYEAKDWDTYLSILNYKISKTNEIKDKNILATLKIQAYLWQQDWDKINALYKQIDMKKLPKKIKLTFLCHYITALFLSDKPNSAKGFITKNKTFLAEGENNTAYQLYLDGFKAFQAYEDGDYPTAKKIFTQLEHDKVGNEFYKGIYKSYLEKIAAKEKENI
ncbi:MAG: hypothetical protein RR385_05190 [Clostridiales bacterium]